MRGEIDRGLEREGDLGERERELRLERERGRLLGDENDLLEEDREDRDRGEDNREMEEAEIERRGERGA
jgi:hypothetical protein